MDRLVVILAYAAALWWILFPPDALRLEADGKVSWWRNVRFWASLIVAAQMAVYAIWG